jgi:hypothetical protein
MAAAVSDSPVIDAVSTPARRRPSTTNDPRLERAAIMIRVHSATAAEDDAPDDPAMRLIEVGLAILAIVAAGILALTR